MRIYTRKYLALAVLLFTFLALFQPSSVKAAALLSALSIGMSGTEVMTLQHDLVQLGYLNTAPTGYFGPITQGAVMSFQSAHGLSPVGYTGPQTRSYLNTLSAGGTIGTSASVSSSNSVNTNSVNTSVDSSSSAPASSSFIASLLAQLQKLKDELAAIRRNFGNATEIAVDSTNLITQFSASPAVVITGGSAALTWSTQNATSCTGTGGTWSGSQSLNGSATISNITSPTTFTLICSNSSTSQSRTIVVNVSNPNLVTPDNVVTTTVTSDTSSSGSVTVSNSSSSNNTSSSPGTTTSSVTVTPGSSGTTVVHDATELTSALKALNNTGGGTILLAPGNYGDYYMQIQWNSGYNFPSPVTITSQDPNNRATFDSLHINLVNGLVLTNVNLPNVASGSNGITVGASQNITVGGIYAHGTDRTGTGFATRDSSNVTIKNSEFGYFGLGLGSYQDIGDISFLYNHIHDVGNDAIDAYQDPGTITIRGNYVLGSDPPSGAHPDCIQTSGGNAATSKVILDENLCVRGNAIGALPQQGVFAGDGPYAYAELDNNLTVCTLYNAVTVSDASSGEVKGNQTISCPDYQTWVRVQSSNNMTISGNITGAIVQPYANTNTIVTNNTIYTGTDGIVSDYTQAAPQIAAWRAQHPLVPTDSYKPVYVALAGSKINSTLALGSTGTQVSTLQQMLHSLGYLNSDITGYFGSLTQQAVSSLQKSNQLASVGVVGPQTRSVLNALLSVFHL